MSSISQELLWYQDRGVRIVKVGDDFAISIDGWLADYSALPMMSPKHGAGVHGRARRRSLQANGQRALRPIGGSMNKKVAELANATLLNMQHKKQYGSDASTRAFAINPATISMLR